MPNLVDLRFEGNLAILELTNGLNEFTHSFMDALNEALDKILDNPKAHALITYGTGSHFSNGISILAVQEDTRSFLKFLKKMVDFMVRLMIFPLPTFAAINGHAFAGGFFFALAHDYRLMNANHGFLSLNEVYIEQMFPITLMEVLRCKLPVGTAQRDFILMGKRITGSEAVELKVVDGTFPADSLLDEAKALARKSLSLGPYTRSVLSDMKKHLYSEVLKQQDPMACNFVPPYFVKSKL